MVMIDISDPVNPHKVSEIETKWSYNFTVSGKHVFIADSPKGPMVININDPSNPVLEITSICPLVIIIRMLFHYLLKTIICIYAAGVVYSL